MYRRQKIVAVVQAQMGSDRLPEKVLMPLRERPVLWHIIERLRGIDILDGIIVITSDSEGDDQVMEFLTWLDDPFVRGFRGPEYDVLERVYMALRDDPPDVVARIGADAPLFSREHLRKSMVHLVDERLDGVHSRPEQSGITRGFESEVFRYQALVDSHLLAIRPEEREQVSRFIRTRPHAFRIQVLAPSRELCSTFRLSLDYPEDYRLIQQVYRALYRLGEPVDCKRVIQWLQMRPDLVAINSQYAQRSTA